MHGRGRHERQTADKLRAHRQAAQDILAGKLLAFCGGQQGRHHDSADMDRRALEGIVVVLSVDSRAIDQRRRHDVVAAGVADQGAGPLGVRRLDHGLDIGLVARGHHQPERVIDGPRKGGAHLLRQVAGLEPGGPGGKRFRREDLVLDHGR